MSERTKELEDVAADAQLVGYQSPAQNALLRGASEIKFLRAQLWTLAELIFHNASSDDAQHWARRITVTIKKDEPPTFAITPVETTREPARLAPGTKVRVLGPPFIGLPVDGWEIENIDEPRELIYRVRHSNGSLVNMPAALIQPEEPTPECDHPRSELLAKKGDVFEMRKCLECTKIFRVRLSVRECSLCHTPLSRDVDGNTHCSVCDAASCTCDDHQGTNLYCPSHGTRASENGT